GGGRGGGGQPDLPGQAAGVHGAGGGGEAARDRCRKVGRRSGGVVPGPRGGGLGWRRGRRLLGRRRLGQRPLHIRRGQWLAAGAESAAAREAQRGRGTDDRDRQTGQQHG